MSQAAERAEDSIHAVHPVNFDEVSGSDLRMRAVMSTSKPAICFGFHRRS